MLWIKSFHIIFVVSWFAGLFYLPRIFVNLAMVSEGSEAEEARLLLMARKLMRFTTLLMVPAVALGLVLWLYYGIGLLGVVACYASLKHAPTHAGMCGFAGSTRFPWCCSPWR
jgi:uncharacterized membrane protein